jgi:hypothetical protein
MAQFSLPLTRLIHENLSIVMTFAFSRRPLETMIDETFKGEWKYLNKAIFSISEERVEKACFELAMFLRILDDDQDISGYDAQLPGRDYGRLIAEGKPDKVLSLRDVPNKIIHASKLEWDFSDEMRPLLICHGRESEKWVRAEVKIIAVAALCGQLMS